jgi:hypothetical protein
MRFSSSDDYLKKTELKNALHKKVIIDDKEKGMHYGTLTSYDPKTGHYTLRNFNDIKPRGRVFLSSKLIRLIGLH